MKTIALLFVASLAVACPKGTHEDYGACAYDTDVPSVKPLDDKLPEGRMPSYQRPEINAVMPNSLISSDENLDKEKVNAESEGKKAAGI